MKNRYQHFYAVAGACALALTLAMAPASAQKPEWAGQGKPGKSEKGGKSHKQGKKDAEPAVDIRVGGYFGEPQRQAARDYYGARARAGRCPPGLAKKNNGCLPPGQAKKWGIGQPLPKGVVYYPVPSTVVIKLGVPPAGYKYVRVAADILLIAIGTRMVVDAIEDLARL